MGVFAKLVLVLCGVVAAASVGYVCRRTGLVSERVAGPLMFRTVVFGWAPLSVLVLWDVPLQWSLIVLPVISVVVPLCMAPFGLVLARAHGLDRRSAGTFIVACGTANIGVTMGGFVCYCLFGITGLGYAQLYTMSWTVPYMLLYYPIARRFGERGVAIDLRFVLSTIFDRRSLPILGALTGLTLNLCSVPRPKFVATYHVVDVLLMTSVSLSFFNIGLQLHFNRIGERPILYVTLAAAKFVCAPVITLALLILLTFLAGPLPETAFKVVLIEGFMPAAVFAVIVSNLYGLNPRLASMLFVVNTATFLVVVLPVLAIIFG